MQAKIGSMPNWNASLNFSTQSRCQSHFRQYFFRSLNSWCQAEPFVSMNEFEKLKCASICNLEVYQHGDVILEGARKEEKLFLALSGSIVATHAFNHNLSWEHIPPGSVSVYNFVEAIALFEVEVICICTATITNMWGSWPSAKRNDANLTNTLFLWCQLANHAVPFSWNLVSLPEEKSHPISSR